jgi:hypothetical protein
MDGKPKLYDEGAAAEEGQRLYRIIQEIETARTRYAGKEAGHECHEPFPFLREITGVPFIPHFVVHLCKSIRVDDEKDRRQLDSMHIDDAA